MARSPDIIPSRNEEETLPAEVADAIAEIGGLDKLTAVLPSAMEMALQVGFHRILSDKIRLSILWAINCCDLCPCVLTEFLHISDSRLSYHLSVLEHAGLITSCPKKNWKIYSITASGREALLTSQECAKKFAPKSSKKK